MAKLVYLFAIVALVQVATALDCYSCDANTCKEDMNKWQKVPNCGKTISNTINTGACLKQVYTDKTTNKEVTIRKCVIADKTASGVSYHCNENEGKASVCEVCNGGDYCNSATSVNFSFVTIVGVIAAYLIPKFL